jgi:hypothetical protein
MKVPICRVSLPNSVVLISLIVTGFVLAHAQSQSTPPSPGRNPEILAASRHSAKAPLGDSETVPAESSVQANARSFAEQQMSHSYGAITDPGLYVNGQTEGLYYRIVDYSGDLGGDFRSGADCVVTGVVTSAAAFLSRTRTWVYSDFGVKVESVLKQDSARPVAAGETLVTYRQGGAIRFPSGHTTNYIVQNEGFPAVGARYLFFLSRWPDQPGVRYYILTAYEFKDGLVYPLDLSVNGGTTEPGKHVMGVEYSEYEGMSEETFMEKVRSAIAAQVKDRSK